MADGRAGSTARSWDLSGRDFTPRSEERPPREAAKKNKFTENRPNFIGNNYRFNLHEIVCSYQ